jgi:putative ABC transport system ATP-binding protein
MNMLGCLDTPTSGELFLDGVDVGKCTDDELSDLRVYKLGFVFQNYQLLARQTALENVELPLTYAKVPRSERRERALEALKKVGLEDRVNHEPSQLSGGQKQRVAIARAIVNRPKLILADEPTGALDSTSGRQIMDLFHSLNEEGMSILMITHDIDIAAHAKRIAIIRDGELNLNAELDPMIIAKRKERENGVNNV